MSEAIEDLNSPPEVPLTLEQRIEAAAKEQGWRPDGALPADEFLIRGSQFHRDLKKTVDEVKAENAKAYKAIGEFMAKTQKLEFEKESAEHTEKLRAAAEAGDADQVQKLAQNAPKPPTPIDDPKYQRVDEWAKSQRWFGENEEMADDAMTFYQLQIRKNGGIDDPDVILPKVEAHMKRTYAEYFKPPENPNRQQRGAGETGGKLRTGKTGPTLDDLTPEEREHFDYFKKQGMDEAKLIASALAARRS